MKLEFVKKIVVSTFVALAAVSAQAATEIVDGIEWTYTVTDGKASIGGGSDSSPAVPRSTSGAITIPSTLGGYPVTSIGSSAFYDCDSLTSVTIPDSVTSIGRYAFYYCSSLRSVTIPDSVTSIGAGAFRGCSSLTRVTIGNSVTSIGGSAFSGCSSLTSVMIPYSVTSIGDGAFYGCSSLTSVMIPYSVTSIGERAFGGCSGLADSNGFVIVKGVLYDYFGEGGDVVIPDSVMSIGSSAFSGCSGLTSVTIPDSVTSIGNYAFSGCSSLTRVTIGNSVTSIGDGAFRGCSSLTSVTIPDSVTSIGDYAFYGCSSLTSVTIPDSVTSIGDYAFYGCSLLTSVTIPNSVTSVGDYAFYYCSSLTSVTIPDSVTSIGDYAFSGCSSLTRVTIPDSVTSIGDYAFYRCKLTSVTVPGHKCGIDFSSVTNLVISEGTESIGDYVFRDCSSLTSVTIPDSVSNIGYGAFEGCSSLMSVYISNISKWCAIKFGNGSANPCYNGAKLYINGALITNLVIPNDVTMIGANAFDGCSSLTEIIIPDSVYSIGANAFANCTGLIKVSMPLPLKYLVEAGNIFTGCSEDVEIVYRKAVITDVVAKLRYPWGKVGITYKVSGNIAAGLPVWMKPVISVSVLDRTTGSNYVAQVSALSGDTGIEEGEHHVVWDLNAQNLQVKSDDMVFTVAYLYYSRYCVIDLSSGVNATSYPVSYLEDVPKGGWTDEYKTTKLVLRLIEPGSFKMNGSYDVTFTKPYYMGVFEVTHKQYELVTGNKSSYFTGDTLPVEGVLWNTIRGDSSTHNWPTVKTVDSNSFIGRIQARTGLNFDLPTEAQWEYACRAGTTTTYYWGDSMDGAYAWYRNNSSETTHKVGTKLPNAWGLYDMSGNVREWCLDWYGSLSSGVDPEGSSSGSNRVKRGGSWIEGAGYCTSSDRNSSYPSIVYNYIGFRIVRTLSNINSERSTEAVAGAERAGEILYFASAASTKIDSCIEPLVDSIYVLYNSAWIGGDESAEVVIGVNGTEIKRTTGEGEFAWAPTTPGKYTLTYTTYINGVAQEEVYTVTVFKDWKYTLEDGKATIIETTQTSGDIVIPSEIDGLPVVGLDENLFNGCEGITSITISSDFVTRLSDMFPDSYNKLTSVTLMGDAAVIPNNAFRGCASLMSFNIQNGVTMIGANAFDGCLSLTEIIIPDSVYSIGANAFANCSSLTKVSMPLPLKEQVESGNVFDGCLENLEIVYRTAEIKNVVAKQRFPWNGKVDIKFEVVGNVNAGLSSENPAELTVSAKDSMTGEEWSAKTVTGDTGTDQGGHHVIWDMKADGLSFYSQNIKFKVGYSTKHRKYCVIDLSAGKDATNYFVSYLDDMPEGGWTDEYKTTKLVLCRIEPGSFKMGGSYDVTLTKPYYMGVFEVTQKQYELVTGNKPSNLSGDTLPVERVSWNMIRGNSSTHNWPTVKTVDSNSFVGRIQGRTGLNFDLPTEAQWEYACRAGTTTTYYWGNSMDGTYAWYSGNSSSKAHIVGTRTPNNWGLYDMSGNVWEVCLDWFGNLSSAEDPKGPSSGSSRVIRGECFSSSATDCNSLIRDDFSPTDVSLALGFRLTLHFDK